MGKAIVIHKNRETRGCLYSVYWAEAREFCISSFDTKEEAIMFCEDHTDCSVIDYIEDKVTDEQVQYCSRCGKLVKDKSYTICHECLLEEYACRRQSKNMRGEDLDNGRENT